MVELKPQRTLRQSIKCYGMGLHTGMIVNMTMRPAEPSTGVVFQRTDIEGQPQVKASYRNIADTNMATSLAEGGVHIRTVEHLLAAFAGVGIDNVIVELDAPEVPIMDGSAAPFIYLIRQAGIAVLDALQPCLRITRQMEVVDGDKKAGVFPSRRTEIFCSIDFNHPLIKEQRSTYIHSDRNFSREIASARTFGFKKDVDTLHENGLARGGSLDNAVVVDDYRVLNAEGLRYRDEFVRHKVLDTLGDIFLAGFPLLGRFVGVRSGHRLNARLITTLMQDSDAWELVTDEVGGETIPEAAGTVPAVTDPAIA